MSRCTRVLFPVAFLTLSVSCAEKRTPPSPQSPAIAERSFGPTRISGPCVHRNLAIYLVHGKDTLVGDRYLTLQEAMEQKKLVVHETGDVQELAVENLSADETVYIQAGDIVRGGRQDRVIRTDLLVSAKSGRVPIASFCVEQGRWSGRGDEPAVMFSLSSNTVATNSLKLAVKRDGRQEAVWREVAANQRALEDKIGSGVLLSASPTSLELTLENLAVKTSSAEYTKEFESIVKDRDDVIGFVTAINGRLNSADVYGSNRLFRKLWPKMLKAVAVEAVAESQTDQPGQPPELARVEAFLADVQNGKMQRRELSARVTSVTRETDDLILFETVDRESGSASVHRNYLNKKFKR